MILSGVEEITLYVNNTNKHIEPTPTKIKEVLKDYHRGLDYPVVKVTIDNSTLVPSLHIKPYISNLIDRLDNGKFDEIVDISTKEKQVISILLK